MSGRLTLYFKDEPVQTKAYKCLARKEEIAVMKNKAEYVALKFKEHSEARKRMFNVDSIVERL